MTLKSEISSKNETKSVHVTVFVVYNGTYVRNSKEDPVLQILEPVFLALFVFITFAFNMFLLITISSSYTLRKVPFNALLASMSFTCLLDCLFNMLIAIHYVTVDYWALGECLCFLSAFTVQLVTVETTFGLCIMCVEACLSLWRPSTFHNCMTSSKQAVAMAILWTAGIVLCLPIATGSIAARAFPSRYGCSSAGAVGFVHSSFLTFWCYALPMMVIILCVFYVALQKHKDYKARKSKKNDVNYSDILFQGDLWTEGINIKLVLLCILLFTILYMPYVVVHQITALNVDDITEMPANVTLPLVQKTPKYETAFTWFRYIFTWIYPSVVLWMRKDIRRKLKSLLSCCQNNIVPDRSPRPLRRENNKKKKDTRKESLTPLSLTTPVLYVSPDGLCLRQLDSKSKPKRKYFMLPEYGNSNWTVEPSFVSYICDLEEGTTDSGSKPNSASSSRETDSRRNSNDSEVSAHATGKIENTLNSPFSEEKLISILQPESKDEAINITSQLKGKDNIGRPKKAVRFADTLTIYKSITPVDMTSSLESSFSLCSSFSKTTQLKFYSGSKIPRRTIRKNDELSWKVEQNMAYRVSAPFAENKIVNSIVQQLKDDPPFHAGGPRSVGFIYSNDREEIMPKRIGKAVSKKQKTRTYY